MEILKHGSSGLSGGWRVKTDLKLRCESKKSVLGETAVKIEHQMGFKKKTCISTSASSPLLAI